MNVQTALRVQSAHSFELSLKNELMVVYRAYYAKVKTLGTVHCIIITGLYPSRTPGML